MFVESKRSPFRWCRRHDCPVVVVVLLSRKGSLRDASENRAEYEAPPQGNLVYKCFSLGGLLLLVRCSIQKVELWPRRKKVKVRRVSVCVCVWLSRAPFPREDPSLSESGLEVPRTCVAKSYRKVL